MITDKQVKHLASLPCKFDVVVYGRKKGECIVSDPHVSTEQELARSLARRVRDTRLARGLNQEELAEAAGISRATISVIEQGATLPTLRPLWAVSRVLGTPLYLFFVPDHMWPGE